jgi:hypothetical protein
MSDNRDKRSISFDRIAALYDRFRPGYPDAVFEDTIALFWNKHVVQTETSANFFQAVQTIHQRIAPELTAKFSGLPHPDEMPTPVRDEIDRACLERWRFVNINGIEFMMHTIILIYSIHNPIFKS